MPKGRPRTRTYPDSALKRAVDVVEGEKWAAAICDLTVEALRQAMERGYLSSGRAAVLLSRATRAKGSAISVDELVGLELIDGGGHPVPSGTEETTQPAKGGRTWRSSSTR